MTDTDDVCQYHEALLILNGIVSHQETKVKMISEGLIFLCFGFLPYPNSNEVVAEALSLLGSLLTIKKGRDQLKGLSIIFIKHISKIGI